MFSGAISVKINSEIQIQAVRTKARWLAERMGLDKGPASVLSAIVSEIARLIISQTSCGRIDIFSIRDKLKKGVTILAFFDEGEKKEIEIKPFEKQKILRRMDLESLAAKKVIDEFRVFPGNEKELLMQITKWV
ncbi:MAG: anti-sigma regulatory factor [Melioribacter sp.]|nr:anti-sigma regulatory factor [Melioribacter sp.]